VDNGKYTGAAAKKLFARGLRSSKRVKFRVLSANKGTGVRPTQLTIKHPVFQKFKPIMICCKIYMIVEMCVMCRPDTHALIIGSDGRITKKMIR